MRAEILNQRGFKTTRRRICKIRSLHYGGLPCIPEDDKQQQLEEILSSRYTKVSKGARNYGRGYLRTFLSVEENFRTTYRVVQDALNVVHRMSDIDRRLTDRRKRYEAKFPGVD